jgi:6-phosphogluconolactonase
VKRITRRGFMYSSAALAVAAKPWFAEAKSANEHLLLVGTQTSGTSKGVYAYSFDAKKGVLTQIGLAAEADMPTFLTISPDGKTVIVANELDTYQGAPGGGVSSYTLDRAAARLTKVNEVASRGAATCHVAVDHTGRCAFAANYTGGSAASFTLEKDGRLSDTVSFFQYTGQGPDKERQEAPHAHRVTVSPDNRFLMVNDLGLDEIHIYRLDASTAKLLANEPAVWKATPGSGPRALQFHPNGKVAYCVTEMASTVVVLRWDSETGALETVQEISMKPDGFTGVTGGDDIVIDREGKFAYATDRFDDIVVTFSIAKDGRLTLVDRTPCGGKIPRHLSLDPSGRWLLIANQVSDNISVFARDPKTGKLTDSGKSFPLSRPQCLVFA